MSMHNFKYPDFLPKTTSRNAWKSLAVILLGLILTISAVHYTKRNVEDQDNHEFALVCNELTNKILTRLNSHAQLLRTSSAFFAASDTITRKDWKEFIEHAQIKENLPGIQGVGFSLIIPKNQLKEHVENIRNEGFPNYTVKPAGERDIYTSIVFLEPFSGRNLRAFGYDMYSEPIRKKAMEQARDSDCVSLSGKVVLVQETNTDVQAGTLMYSPVYKKGMPVNTVEQRRAAIKGWVYSPYRMNDLMKGILGRWDLKTNARILLQVYDNDNISKSSILFDSQINETIINNELQSRALNIPIDFNGKKWTLQFIQTREPFFYSKSKVIIVLISGILISLLLYFLSLAYLNTSYNAQQIATKLTRELKESESRFKNMFKMHNAIMLLIEPESGQIVDANNSASEFYGYSISELSSMSFNDINTLKPEETAAVRRQIAEKKQNYFIFKHKLANHEIHTVDVYSSLIAFENRKIIFAIMHDISDRTKAEEALKEAQNCLNKILQEQSIILETATFGISMIVERKQIWVNQAMSLMFGYTKEEMIDKTTRILYTSDEAYEKFGEEAYPELSKGLIYETVQELITKNGSHKLIRYLGKAVNPDDLSKGCIWCIEDITERKRTEEALRENDLRLNLAMKVANMAWWEMDINSGSVTFENRKAEMLGYQPDNFKHYNDFTALLHPEDYDKAMNAMKIHLDGLADKYEVEYRIRTKTGIYKWFYDIGTIGKRDSNGKPLNITGIVIDITERKQAELILLEQNEEIETQNEEYVQINEDLRQTNEELLIIKNELEKSYEKFRTVADYTYDWEYWKGQNNQIIYMSPSCERISGYKPEEFLSDNTLLKKNNSSRRCKVLCRSFKQRTITKSQL